MRKYNKIPCSHSKEQVTKYLQKDTQESGISSCLMAGGLRDCGTGKKTETAQAHSENTAYPSVPFDFAPHVCITYSK